jgi:hypothetical protein
VNGHGGGVLMAERKRQGTDPDTGVIRVKKDLALILDEMRGRLPSGKRETVAQVFEAYRPYILADYAAFLERKRRKSEAELRKIQSRPKQPPG